LRRKTFGSSAVFIFKRDCALLPEELLWSRMTRPGERVRVVPGALRLRDVRVGRHIAISVGAPPRFLQRFEEVYSKTGKAETIIATAGAHHRLLWMHPFLDGNG
jgi:Fic family protein